MIDRSFPSVALIASVLLASTVTLAAEPVKDSARGVLQVDAKPHQIARAAAYPTKVFDEEGYAVILCDHDFPVDKLKASLDKKGNDDDFFLFQPHVTITFHKDGKAAFSNMWADNKSVSVGGSNLQGEITINDGRASGKATLTDSDKKDSFDVSFDLPLMKVTPLPPEPKKEKKPKKVAESTTSKSDQVTGKAPRAGETKSKTNDISAHTLPIPADATNVEFKQLVQMVHFESASDMKTTATFMIGKLAQQGWAKDGADLLASKSSILKRTRGDAKLTIFVKPNGAGSKVTIMSDGLSWEDK